MKVIKYFAVFVYLCTLSLLFFLHEVARKNLNFIESKFNMAVSLTGAARSEVVADRIIAFDEVKDAKIMTSAQIFDDFKKNEVFSEKITLEENPFSDYIVVSLARLDKNIQAVAEKIKGLHGVDDVVYDGLTADVYNKLANISRLIAVFLIFLSVSGMTAGFYYIFNMREHRIKSFVPAIYIISAIMVCCFLIAKYVYSIFDVNYNYLTNISFLLVFSALAVVVCAER